VIHSVFQLRARRPGFICRSSQIWSVCIRCAGFEFSSLSFSVEVGFDWLLVPRRWMTDLLLPVTDLVFVDFAVSDFRVPPPLN
jgi:hypothetical protein